jgi:hypothetical protein
MLLPFTPLAPLFQFTPLPLHFLAVLGLIVAAYIGGAGLTKRLFYRDRAK